MTRTGAYEPTEVHCRNGHKFNTTVRREGTKCPECTLTVYVRKDGTVGYLRGETTDPTPGRTEQRKSTVAKARVTSVRRQPRQPRSTSDKNGIQPTPDDGKTGQKDTDKTIQPTPGRPVQSDDKRVPKHKRAGVTPYGHIY